MKLPALRRDLSLEPQVSWRHGQPVWLLKDPVQLHYYRISNITRLIIAHWDTLEPQALLEQLHQQGHVDVSEEDIKATLEFLVQNQLIQKTGPSETELARAGEKKGLFFWLRWLVHHYLFFKIPLVKPHRFLCATLPLVRGFFSRRGWLITAGLGLYAVYATLQQWAAFTAPLDNLFSLDGILTVFFAMLVVKCAHELGHAYACTYYGGRVHSMGVAFLVMFPMLYTDTSDAWRLNDPKKRLLIDCAGVLAETQLMVCALLLWHVVDSTIIKSGITYLITVGLVSTLLINLSPLMRFDGYYALSNALAIDNLQPRSFALARWALRRWLIGLYVPPPFYVPYATQRLMIVYAYATWIYRFFLFIGIAALVYFMFFKLLGIVLFLIEIIYFVLGPIVSEILYLLRHLKKARLNRHTAITGVALALILLILCIPWQARMSVPGILVFAHKKNIYTELPCEATSVSVRNQQPVAVNAPLFTCSSPDLKTQEALLQLKIKRTEKQIRQQQGLGSVLGPKQVGASDLAALRNELENIMEEQQRLNERAPFAGLVINRSNLIGSSRWYGEDSYLLSVIIPNQWHVIAYVPESSVYRLNTVKHAFFLSNLPDTPPITLQLLDSSLASAGSLDTPYLASLYGGPLNVTQDPATKAMQLKQAAFPFVFDVQPPYPNLSYEQRGIVVLEGQKESLLKRFYVHALSLLVRESTF